MKITLFSIIILSLTYVRVHIMGWCSTTWANKSRQTLPGFWLLMMPDTSTRYSSFGFPFSIKYAYQHENNAIQHHYLELDICQGPYNGLMLYHLGKQKSTNPSWVLTTYDAWHFPPLFIIRLSQRWWIYSRCFFPLVQWCLPPVDQAGMILIRELLVIVALLLNVSSR